MIACEVRVFFEGADTHPHTHHRAIVSACTLETVAVLRLPALLSRKPAVP